MNRKVFFGAILCASVVATSADATVTAFFSAGSSCSSPISSTNFTAGSPGPTVTVSLCVSTTAESVCGATVQLQSASAAEDARFKVLGRSLGSSLTDANNVSVSFPVSITKPNQTIDFGATVTTRTPPPAPGSNQLIATFSLQPQSTATNSSYVISLSGLSSIATENSDCFGSPSDMPINATLTLAQASAGSNVALASNGATALASSTFSAAFAASSVIDNERAGVNWGNGGGWNDATGGTYPDYVEIRFNGPKTINRAVVYTLQDNLASPTEPTDVQTFSSYGVTGFTVQGWDGSSWVTLGTVNGNNLVKRTVTFADFTTDRIRVNVTTSLANYSRLTEVEAWGVDASVGSSNVALSSAGAVALASSTYSAGFSVDSLINNDRTGAGWGNGGGWNDATAGGYPDFVEIDFNGLKTINRVVVYTLQDNFSSPIEPTDVQTFSSYGVTDFAVQGWNGSAWQTLAVVTGNNLVKRTVNFAAFTTDRIRINVTNSLAGFSRLTEIEAWGFAATSTGTNVALASAGSTASASSTYGSGFLPSSVIDNERAGLNWGNGGGWNDATAGSYPDYVEIDFNGPKTINRVVVFTLQDNLGNPVEPTDALTFSSYGVTAFTVQGWDGSTWVTLATVSGNNLVKRTVTFADFTTDRIRVNVTNSLAAFSRITEIEAWGVDSGGGNVALATAGATASASSSFSVAYPVSSVINGERAGANWGNGGGWNDATGGTFPDFVDVQFNGVKLIDRVVVYTLQDSFSSPIEPTNTLTFSCCGLTDYTVQGWNGSAWVTLATVTGNNLVKRAVVFPPYSTDRIRVNVTGASAGYSRITEVEAWLH